MSVELMRCEQAMREVAAALLSHGPADLGDTARSHLSGCSSCRAALLLVLYVGGAAPPAPEPPGCAGCLADLAGLIELEASAPGEAAHLYPHVWWHLWLCASCADTYALALTLLEADQPMICPLYQAPAIHWLPPITLSRDELRLVLPQRFDASLVMRGAGQRHVIFEDAIGEDCQCTVWADLLDRERCRLSVGVRPPLAGAAALRCGGLCVRANFDARGTAVMPALPIALLLEPGGPDVAIEFEEAQGSN